MSSPYRSLGRLTRGELREKGNMGRTEAKNVLSGLEGEPCGGQRPGSPSAQPEMEQQQQPQVKNLVSHFPTSTLGGWESMEQTPNEKIRGGGNQDLSFTEEQSRVPWLVGAVWEQ